MIVDWWKKKSKEELISYIKMYGGENKMIVDWWKKKSKEELISYGVIAVIVIIIIILFGYVSFVKFYSESIKIGCTDSCLDRVNGDIINCYFETDTFMTSQIPDNYTMLRCDYIINETKYTKSFYIHQKN